MAVEWKVAWTEPDSTHEIVLNGREATLAYIAGIHARETNLRPVLEVMKAASGNPSLSIVVGGDETVVTYEETADPPYYISIGDGGREGVSPVFFHGGQGIEHLARNLVPFTAGLRAVAEFLENERRPEMIAWERL